MAKCNKEHNEIAQTAISECGITGQHVYFIETTVQQTKLFVHSWIENTLGYWIYYPGATHSLVSNFFYKEGAHKISK